MKERCNAMVMGKKTLVLVISLISFWSVSSYGFLPNSENQKKAQKANSSRDQKQSKQSSRFQKDGRVETKKNDSSNSNFNNQSSGQGELVNRMNRRTKKGLKTFKPLLKQSNKNAKQNFFADVGQNPDASDFEGSSSDGPSVKQKQFKIGKQSK
jgi:hypothetical protein